MLWRRAHWRSLRFLEDAFDDTSGRFRNFRRVDGTWLDGTASEDSQGRAMLALGETVSAATDEQMTERASLLFLRALPAAQDVAALRAQVVGAPRLPGSPPGPGERTDDAGAPIDRAPAANGIRSIGWVRLALARGSSDLRERVAGARAAPSRDPPRLAGHDPDRLGRVGLAHRGPDGTRRPFLAGGQYMVAGRRDEAAVRPATDRSDGYRCWRRRRRIDIPGT